MYMLGGVVAVSHLVPVQHAQLRVRELDEEVIVLPYTLLVSRQPNKATVC